MELAGLVRRICAWLRRPWRRRGEALSLALLGVCAAGSQQAGDPQEQAKGITINLGADDFEYSDDERTAILTGNVTVRATDLPGGVPQVELRSDRVTVSLGPGDVVAPGTTVLVSPGVEISGEALRFNLRTQDFHVENARSAMVVSVQGREVTVFAQSQSIDGKAGEAEMRRARITTCELAHPHYALLVRRADVVPSEDRLTVYGGAIELYGTRVPLIPKLNTSLGLGDDGSGFELSFPGHSSVDGWYYPLDRRFTDPKAPFQLRGNLRLAQHSVLSGRVLSEYKQGGLHAWTTVVRRDQRPDDINQRLLYDAQPELGVGLSREVGASTWSAQIGGGYYRERNLRTLASAAGSGVTARLGWDWKQGAPGRKPELFGGIGLRGSLYSSGDSYRTLDLHVGRSHPLWENATGTLELRHHFIDGQTPFEFDDIDLQTEAFGKLDTPLFGPCGITLDGRYDLGRAALRDYDVGVHLRQHCLTWTLNYNKAHSRVGVGINLTDFMLGGRPRPQRAPKGTLGPWGAIASQPLQRQGLDRLPEAPVPSGAPLIVAPSEFTLSRDHQQRAPAAPPDNDLPPPPSLRVASAATLQ